MCSSATSSQISLKDIDTTQSDVTSSSLDKYLFFFVMGAQDLLDSFYSIDNLVTFDFVVDDAKWAALLAAEPKNVGQRNPDGSYDMPIPPARHYEWTTATSVTISTSKNPTQSTRFENVGIVKKAWYGKSGRMDYLSTILRQSFNTFCVQRVDCLCRAPWVAIKRSLDVLTSCIRLS